MFKSHELNIINHEFVEIAIRFASDLIKLQYTHVPSRNLLCTDIFEGL